MWKIILWHNGKMYLFLKCSGCLPFDANPSAIGKGEIFGSQNLLCHDQCSGNFTFHGSNFSMCYRKQFYIMQKVKEGPAIT